VVAGIATPQWSTHPPMFASTIDVVLQECGSAKGNNTLESRWGELRTERQKDNCSKNSVEAGYGLKSKTIVGTRGLRCHCQVSCFFAKKTDLTLEGPQTLLVKKHSTKTRRSSQPMAIIRRRVETEGERLWRLGLKTLPISPSAPSRKLYHAAHARVTLNASAKASTTGRGKQRSARAVPIRPQSRDSLRGVRAFSLRASPPPISWVLRRRRRGRPKSQPSAIGETIVHTRRPEAWTGLSDTDAALLDFLRRAGKTSELSPEETIRRTISLLSEDGRFERLAKITPTEPPRVRAMLGAVGEQLGKKPSVLNTCANT
jgi:hypothetical protein